VVLAKRVISARGNDVGIARGPSVGDRRKSEGVARQALQDWFSGTEGPLALFAGRVLTFDERAGLIWARPMAEGTAKGRPRSALDMITAAIAEANECVVVTDNEKDFAGLKIVNHCGRRLAFRAALARPILSACQPR
jgi:hypothetical protein